MLGFVIDGLLDDGGGDAVRLEAVDILEGGHGPGDIHVIDAVDFAVVQPERLEAPLQRPHGGTAAAMREGDVHGGGGIGVGDGILEIQRGQSGLRHAQQVLGLADGANGGERVFVGDLPVVDAQRAELHLQIPDLAAGAAPAKHTRLVGNAQELAVGLAVGGVERGLVEQVPQGLVPFAVLVDLYLCAHGAVLGDELRVLGAHANAAVGDRIAKILHGLFVDGALVGTVVKQRVEHHVVVDAGGVAGIAAKGPEVKPLLALAVPLAFGHGEGTQGGGVVRAGGAQPLHDNRAAVPVFIDGDDLVDDVHIHPVRGYDFIRPGKWGDDAHQQRRDYAVQRKFPCFHGGYYSLIIDITSISQHCV